MVLPATPALRSRSRSRSPPITITLSPLNRLSLLNLVPIELPLECIRECILDDPAVPAVPASLSHDDEVVLLLRLRLRLWLCLPRSLFRFPALVMTVLLPGLCIASPPSPLCPLTVPVPVPVYRLKSSEW